MHALMSYHLDESLDSGTSVIRTSYACRAPDECRASSNGGFQMVWIGGTLYMKRAPGEGWIVQPNNRPFQISSFLWDYVPDRILDPRIVGAARIGGGHHDPVVLRAAQRRRLLVPVVGRPQWPGTKSEDERVRSLHEPELLRVRRADHDHASHRPGRLDVPQTTSNWSDL